LRAAVLSMTSGLGTDSRERVTRRLLALSGPGYRLAVRLTGSHEEAEDVVQQAYLEAVTQVRAGAEPVGERTWFLRVVANRAKDRLRSETSRKRREAAMRPKEESARAPGGGEAEIVPLLRRAVDSLEPRYRAPIALCYEEGLTQREAAAVLEMPESTISKYVNVGLERLRKALARAGYAALPAAVLGGLKETAPLVPSSLASQVEALMARGATSSAGSAGGASVAAPAVKGGFVMKLVAGIVLAGAVAGVAAVSLPGSGGALPAEAPSGATGEFAHDQRYTMEPVYGFKRGAKPNSFANRLDNPGILNGPGTQAHGSNGLPALSVDGAGNAYWCAKGTWPEVRRWDVETGRVTTVAGSACGYLDGPVARARFAGWGYNGGANISTSRDGKHILLRDRRLWRHVDLDAGKVETVCPFMDGGNVMIVKDKSGEVYAFRADGKEMPDCAGYRKLKIAPFQHDFKGRGKKGAYIGGFISGWALDAENMKFYWHSRNAPWVCDLKTGETRVLTTRGKNPRPGDVTGSFEGMSWHCPSGMGISRGGRYLFIGGGDSGSFYRLDLEKKDIDRFARLADGVYGWADGGEKDKGHWIVNWPSSPDFAADGSACWGTSGGMFRIVPVK